MDGCGKVREEAFNYDYPLSQPGDNIRPQGTGASWLSSSFGCWVHNPDHPDGEERADSDHLCACCSAVPLERGIEQLGKYIA